MSHIPIGVEVGGEGAHPASWRHADSPPNALLAPARITDRFRALDDSGLGFAIVPQQRASLAFPDVQGQLDAVEVAVYAAATTSRIALIPESNAIHAEPFHLANQLNTLDWAAKGRSGWLVATDASDAVAAGYGREPRQDPGAAARETREIVEAVRRLWDTWEDDIFLADEQTHRFLDLDRWHYADFEGEFFSIKGPGLLPRPPQGQLPIWSRRVDETIAPHIDIALLSGGAVSSVAEAARLAVEAGAPRTAVEVEVVLDARGERAPERLKRLDRATPWAASDRIRLIGGPESVADRLAELSDHVDGIHLHPAVLDVDLPVIIDSVLPALERAGVLRSGAGTLRELFRLERPANIFATA